MRNERKPTLTRRSFTAGAALACLAGPRLVRAEDAPPSVLIIGDSLIKGGFGTYIFEALKDEHGYPTRRLGKSATGLARPDYFDWQAAAKELTAEEQPDASIVLFGGNDTQGLFMGDDQWIRWNEDGWWEEYARRVVALCDTLSPNGQQIFWIGLPIMRPDKFRRRCKKVNTIYRAEMAIRRNATFIDTWDLFSNSKREFARSLYLEPPNADGSKRKKAIVRAADGIHLSPAGGHYLKRHVLKRVLPALQVEKT